jgi:dTDP-4-dehydrorhamnose reductase
MTIVVIGKTGQVARALKRRAEATGVALELLGREEFDLETPDTDAIVTRAPRVIINAAAYTAVDQAEREPEQAFQINAAGPETAAAAAAQVGAAFIQISTDYVFSGDKPAPYVETDETGPTGVYGASKLEGEQRVRAANPRSVIVRTAWVFNAEGKNFVRTMLRLAKTRPEVAVVADQHGCPTFAGDLASALLSLAQALGEGRSSAAIYHCAGAGETTWAGFAEAIFAEAGRQGGPSATVAPILTSAYPTPAKRPANSRLDCTRLWSDHGVRMRPWTESLKECVSEIAAGGWRVE